MKAETWIILILLPFAIYGIAVIAKNVKSWLITTETSYEDKVKKFMRTLREDSNHVFKEYNSIKGEVITGEVEIENIIRKFIKEHI